MRNPMRNPEILWNPRTSLVVPRGRLPRGATGEGLRGIAGPHPGGATNQPQPVGGHQSRGPWGATPGPLGAAGSVLGTRKLRS